MRLAILLSVVCTYLHFKGEVFLQVLNDHDKEGKLDAQGLLGISRTCDVRCAE